MCLYEFAYSAPYAYGDPSGEHPLVVGAVILGGAAAGALIDGGISYLSGEDSDVVFARTAVGAFGGALQVALSMTPIGPVGAGIASAFVSGLGHGIIDQGVAARSGDCEGFTWGSALGRGAIEGVKAATIAGIAGAIGNRLMQKGPAVAKRLFGKGSDAVPRPWLLL